jgi:hypothetical protein
MPQELAHWGSHLQEFKNVHWLKIPYWRTVGRRVVDPDPVVSGPFFGYEIFQLWIRILYQRIRQYNIAKKCKFPSQFWPESALKQASMNTGTGIDNLLHLIFCKINVLF